ncbi:MAG TPA: cellulase family glycosylhydrolase [Thermoleophilaceae bacterium]|nr:cellulase family glycosylhydrolase [Thermoleophilaceae bacterium]
MAVLSVTVAPSADQKPTATPCGPIRAGNEAKARLQVVGNQMQDSNGNVVMPYGVSLVSGPSTVNWRRSERAVAAQIVAAHRYWHANTIRLQISEKMLFTNPTRGRSYNVPFVRSVDRLVCRIIKQGDIPVINATTIFTGRERGPRALTVRFWRFMSKRYGNRFPVIFDLFNEPQVTRSSGSGRFLESSHVWRVWRDGGVVSGVRYVGMQDLVDEIRVKQRVGNVIWAEEPYYTQAERASLNLLPSYLLEGKDIVYAFHKPSMDQSSRSFSNVREVAQKGIPLVDSEWGQFAATDRPWMCQPDAYTTAPSYLQSMRDLSIGVLAWSLQPGALVKGILGEDTVHDGNDWRYTQNPRDLAQPSEMKSDYGCTTAARGQGAGSLLMDYFKRYSERPPATLFPKLG